jgi:hypothetical protein
MFNWRRNKAEKDYYRTKHARDLEQRYEEARESDIRLLRSERAYSKNIESILGKYQGIEENTGIDLGSALPGNDGDYSELLEGMLMPFITERFGKHTGGILKNLLKQHKDEVNAVMGNFIAQIITNHEKNKAGGATTTKGSDAASSAATKKFYEEMNK